MGNRSLSGDETSLNSEKDILSLLIGMRQKVDDEALRHIFSDEAMVGHIVCHRFMYRAAPHCYILVDISRCRT